MDTKSVIALVILVAVVSSVSTVLLMNVIDDDSGALPIPSDEQYVKVEHQYNLNTYSPTEGKKYSLQFSSEKSGFVRISFGQGITGDYPYHQGDNYIRFDQVQRGGMLSFAFYDRV